MQSKIIKIRYGETVPHPHFQGKSMSAEVEIEVMIDGEQDLFEVVLNLKKKIAEILVTSLKIEEELW